ncbi:katanin p60 ATPase-containing subunit A-like 2 [Planococcus citri]|uniref:katanin p60 ATPase-containing subunit A-like 2 n=1 Tax=Planococcus citri TaxID=170843 RepID=UPI0031F96DC3
MKDRKRALRKKHILHLMETFLIDNGYKETAQCLRSEARLAKDYIVCDNINLETIVIEFETFYYHRFQTYPQLCKRTEPKEVNSSPANQSPVKKQLRKTHQLKQRHGAELDFMICNTFPPPSTMNSLEKVAYFQREGDDFRVLDETCEFSDIVKDICIEPAATRWDEIIGLDDVKEVLKEAIIYPIKYPHLFTGIIEPWKGVLLYGPPGTGKTSLARAVATESSASFYNISASSIVNKWRGDTEKIIKVLFETAQNFAPSIIFIDEIDALTMRRNSHEHEASRRMKSELFTGLDSLSRCKRNVFFLATTNTPWDLDEAMLRRFEKHVLIPVPDLQTRKSLIRYYLPKIISHDPAIECDINYDTSAQVRIK